MAVSSTGSASTLDVASIVSQLMTVEQRPVLALDRKEAQYQAKISAYGGIKAALSQFQTAVQGLNVPAKFSANTATPSDLTVLTATASTSAAVGVHSVEVTKLAQAQKLVAPGQATTIAAIGVGTLTFDFGTITDAVPATFNAVTGQYGAGTTFTSGNAAKTVVIDSSHDTLEGIRSAINSAAIGVTASIVNDGGASPQRLVLTSNVSGKASSMKISVVGDAALSALLANDPAGTQHLSEVATAQNAELKVDGVAVSKTSNTVTDVLDGVSLTLNKIGASSLNVARDTATIKTSVQGFVTAYNSLQKTLASVSAYDPKTKTAGLLQGESSVRNILSQINAAMTSPISGLTGTNTALTQIGISFQKDGSLALDANRLQSVINNNFSDIARLFTAMGTTSDSQIQYLASSSVTQPGTYSVNITSLATGAVNAAGSIGGLPADGAGQALTGQPGSGASGLQIQVNGGAVGDRGTVTFTRGYADRLDKMIGNLLSTSGVVATQTAGLNQSVKDIGSRRDALNQRLSDTQARYTKQFSALNTLLGTMQQTSDFLTQQLANIPKA